MTAEKIHRAEDFNPLPPHGGRPWQQGEQLCCPGISIHSLRMEGDCIHSLSIQQLVISIHSLRMEGDRNIPA